MIYTTNKQIKTIMEQPFVIGQLKTILKLFTVALPGYNEYDYDETDSDG
jgi:hypothetical protein